MGWSVCRTDSDLNRLAVIFSSTAIEGVLRVEPERHADDRGFFARTFCQQEFAAQARPLCPVQCSTSFNIHRYTLRGLHYQAEPHGEEKLVRCTRGAVFDVAVDLRRESATFLQAVTVILSPENGTQLLIPRGCAHGFLTLEANCEVEYMMTEFFEPKAACGVRWNDPRLALEWPAQPEKISDQDRNWPDLF